MFRWRMFPLCRLMSGAHRLTSPGSPNSPKSNPQQQVRHPEKRERVDPTQASPNPGPKKKTQVDAASRVNNHMCKIGTVQIQETLVDPTVGMWQCKVTVQVMATNEVFTVVSTEIGQKAAKRTAFEDAALRLNVREGHSHNTNPPRPHCKVVHARLMGGNADLTLNEGSYLQHDSSSVAVM